MGFTPTPVDGRHDLVVIGASAGGVKTLQGVVAQLPADLPAAVCIVVHLAPMSRSALAEILERAGSLPCGTAGDGDLLRRGEILVAPPDRHLEIEGGHVRLTVGPRENGHRPAIDALFRSAAEALDGRVVGVVLTGMRDDGTAGLAVIKASGGAAVVQDPDDALFAAMPANALANVAVDAVVPATLVAAAVTALVKGEKLPEGAAPREPVPDPPDDESVSTVCPECGGVLTERFEAGMTQWECRVGHRYSQASLVDAQADGVEAALWVAIRALKDRRILLERMATQLEAREQRRTARSLRRRAEEAHQHADLVRDALAREAEATLRGVEQEEPPPELGEAAG